jgi:hypothetical protein
MHHVIGAREFVCVIDYQGFDIPRKMWGRGEDFEETIEETIGWPDA